jgi:hypothetical protein
MINTSGIKRVLTLLKNDLSAIAVGDGSVPALSATTLSAETYRKPISTSIIDGAVLVSEIFFDENEGNGLISEIGILGGSNQLFASGAASIIKNSTESLTVSFEIEVKEVK